MKIRSAFSALALCPFVIALPVAFSQGPGPVQTPWVPMEGAVNMPYCGTVTEITKNTITIQWTSTIGEKPKTFRLSETLAAGKVPMDPRLMPGQIRGYSVSASDMYRLTDVKIRDSVLIHYARLNEVDICDHINIGRRPGGRIPPLPKEAEDRLNIVEIMKARLPAGTPLPPSVKNRQYIPHHEWMNAYWDLEDKGIPYPEKFGKKRRWPIAPPPREVELPLPIID